MCVEVIVCYITVVFLRHSVVNTDSCTSTATEVHSGGLFCAEPSSYVGGKFMISYNSWSSPKCNLLNLLPIVEQYFSHNNLKIISTEQKKLQISF